MLAFRFVSKLLIAAVFDSFKEESWPAEAKSSAMVGAVFWTTGMMARPSLFAVWPCEKAKVESVSIVGNGLVGPLLSKRLIGACERSSGSC
ncbi:MAG: hypothetical protein RLN70_00820 [Rhodospirillaceae bacterium]